ncbi:type II toxin-antitoxin system HicA family toxin [uncultured Rhodospira sp.]|uniref:type II toxin-antitoxin system HicA family toxin n=1 Tax=uncultured Rhodospira sp. TaxID=1936189 RepID=UPI00262376D9|nr:type II toxin-antitoxin system HicA family toxin [uncultured Rhodospira sp.]
MNADQFERWLRKQGIEVRDKKGTGHKFLLNPANGKTSQIPTHGGRKQLKTGLMEGIKKDLGLK